MKEKLFIIINIISLILTSNYLQEQIEKEYKLLENNIKSFQGSRINYLNQISVSDLNQKQNSEYKIRSICNSFMNIESFCQKDKSSSELALINLKKEFNDKSLKTLQIVLSEMFKQKETMLNIKQIYENLEGNNIKEDNDDINQEIEKLIKDNLNKYNNGITNENQDDNDIDSILIEKAYIDKFYDKFITYKKKFGNKISDNENKLQKKIDELLDNINNNIKKIEVLINKLSYIDQQRINLNSISICYKINEIKEECNQINNIYKSIFEINKFKNDLL